MAGIKFGGFKFRSCDDDATVILIVTFLAIISGFWAQQSAYIVALVGPFSVLYLPFFVLFRGYSHCVANRTALHANLCSLVRDCLVCSFTSFLSFAERV